MELPGEISREIRKASIKNAANYGKARESTVLNAILSKFPNMRSEIKRLSIEVNSEVKRVNGLSVEQLASEAEEYADEFKEEKKEKTEKTAKPKMVLEGALAGAFTTRFPPEPNGYMHIGHAKAAFMEKEFSSIYGGKINLYFDDTNPEVEKQEYVDAFKKDLQWLGISFDAEYYASDNIEQMYFYASVLIEKEKAYVCDCSPETMKENRSGGTDCKHKGLTSSENLSRWKEMLSGNLAEAVLRYKGAINDQNTAMRDPTLFRMKAHEHYRQGRKYVVWPTYDFNTPIMDSLNGITDVLRSKEYELRDQLYYEILGALGLRTPRIYSFARLEINDNITSKRKLKELINKNKLWGFDDPRLVTIAGLRRRGVLPQAIRSFVLRFGMSKTDSKVSLDMLLAENRKLIDGISARLFFIKDPVEITVKGIPDSLRKIEIKSHPSENLGHRKYNLSDTFFINAYDAFNLKDGDTIRFKDAFGIKIDKAGNKAIEASYISECDDEVPKIPWVNKGNCLKATALEMGKLLIGDEFNEESMLAVEGFTESKALDIEEGSAVQFERMGFFKFDQKEKMVFIGI